MINFHGYKGKFPDLDKKGLLDWLLENAKIRTNINRYIFQ